MDIILTGGGTAGHVSPALAIAEEILDNDPKSRILFIGREGGGENAAVLKAGLELKTLNIQGIKRKLTLDNARRIYHALRARREAKSIIREFKPDVILGTGGYVCWPVIRAGAKLGIPTAIHESNITPGLTTRLLSTKCKRVFLNHEDTKKYLSQRANTLTVGNPLRKDFKKIKRNDARRTLGIKEDEIFILSFGGSIGAEKLNEVVLEVMQSYSLSDKKIRHIHATGKRYFDSVKNTPLARGERGCKVLPYIDNMPTMLSAADIVISRAGAMTISEISAVGVASILVPSPNVSDNHQLKNAQKLKEVGAALMIEEKNLTVESLKNSINDLKNDENGRKNRAKRILGFSSPDAQKRIVKELKSVIFDDKM